MFKPADMEKVRIIGIRNEKDKILTFLQEEGVVQIKEAEVKKKEERTSAQRETSTLATRLNRIERTLDHYREEETSIMSTITSKGSEPKEIDYIGTEEINKEAEKVITKLEKETDSLSQELQEIDNKIEKSEKTLDTLKEIEKIDIDLSLLESEGRVQNYFGYLEIEQEKLEEKIPTSTFLKTYELEEDRKVVLISSLGELENIERDINEIDVTGLEGTPEENINRLESELEDLENQRENVVNEFKEYSNQHYEEVKKWIEIIENEIEKNSEYQKLGRSRETFVLTGWIPKKEVEELELSLKDFTDEKIIFKIENTNTNPENEDEKVPTLLENSSIVKPFELITKMFGVPKPNRIDPTPIIAITFSLFFGFMLTDFVYGLFLLGLSAFVVMNKEERDGTYNLFAIIIGSGIFTMILGAVFGSYFGNFPETVGEMMGMTGSIVPRLVDPLTGSMLVLGVSLVIGITHLLLGNVIGLVLSIRENEVLKGILDNASWILLILGIGAFAINIQPLDYGLIGVGLILVVVGGLKEQGAIGGLLSIIDIFGFLGDWFSYARLLALGLGTTGIAMVINLIVQLSWPIKLSIIPVGAIFAIIVFFGGHLFNLLINSLGAFVHSLRLHYVEFFGQFYEPEGVEFTPFKSKRKLTKLKLKEE